MFKQFVTMIRTMPNDHKLFLTTAIIVPLVAWWVWEGKDHYTSKGL